MFILATCELPKDPGNCNGGSKRWYFNPESAKCELFLYGGCGGNLNRFKHFQTCNEYCIAAIEKHKKHGKNLHILFSFWTKKYFD